MKNRHTVTCATLIAALACMSLQGKPVSAKDAIAKMRVVQGKYPYTEVNDRAMNGIIAADRAIDAAWVEAAKDPAAFKARQERVRQAWLDSIGGFPERCDLDVKTTGVIQRDGYRIEKTLFQSRPGHHVTATVFVPTDPRFKAPCRADTPTTEKWPKTTSARARSARNSASS